MRWKNWYWVVIAVSILATASQGIPREPAGFGIWVFATAVNTMGLILVAELLAWPFRRLARRRVTPSSTREIPSSTDATKIDHGATQPTDGAPTASEQPPPPLNVAQRVVLFVAFVPLVVALALGLLPFRGEVFIGGIRSGSFADCSSALTVAWAREPNRYAEDDPEELRQTLVANSEEALSLPPIPSPTPGLFSSGRTHPSVLSGERRDAQDINERGYVSLGVGEPNSRLLDKPRQWPIHTQELRVALAEGILADPDDVVASIQYRDPHECSGAAQHRLAALGLLPLSGLVLGGVGFLLFRTKRPDLVA